MENVKGLLSSKIKEKSIFEEIMRDLKDRDYNIYSFTKSRQLDFVIILTQISKFIIKAEYTEFLSASSSHSFRN